MSTNYGKVRLRDGSELVVEAFGATGCVKLIKTGFFNRDLIVIDDPAELSRLRNLLDVAYDHVWVDQ